MQGYRQINNAREPYLGLEWVGQRWRPRNRCQALARISWAWVRGKAQRVLKSTLNDVPSPPAITNEPPSWIAKASIIPIPSEPVSVGVA